ncbi:MAG: YdjY domain-containing protein [Verrucomicrobiota bacterium]
MKSCLLTFVGCFLTASFLSAQQPSPDQIGPGGNYRKVPDQPLPKAETSVEKLGEGRYRMGQILINAKEKELQFPVALGITDSSPLEYVLVHSHGKTHESLLITDVSPELLHVAALLLSVKGKREVKLVLSWNVYGPEEEVEVSDLIRILLPEQYDDLPLSYDAAILSDGTLAAQMELSIVALIDDPMAMVRHEIPSEQNSDEVYRVNTDHQLPKKGLPLTLTMKFAQAES